MEEVARVEVPSTERSPLIVSLSLTRSEDQTVEVPVVEELPEINVPADVTLKLVPEELELATVKRLVLSL